ncbi:MAG: nicotinate-nucleotide--dimethylbenzimidazole phosphoribosyltransferase, partial [Magnetococcales bacterium]|nr:nicotinate-nucleotide--dimethylbenzimidazole phosphoribosyltransferase [Magnetococcales bacterium]
MSSAWHQQPIQSVSNAMAQTARDQFARLPGPPGSLGMLEEIASRLAGMQNRLNPKPDPCQLTLFAADHGIHAAGVAGQTPELSPALVRNAINGGSPGAVLARNLGARIEVVDVGLLHDPGELPGLIRCRIGNGSTDFRTTPAMSDHQLHAAMNAG